MSPSFPPDQSVNIKRLGASIYQANVQQELIYHKKLHHIKKLTKCLTCLALIGMFNSIQVNTRRMNFWKQQGERKFDVSVKADLWSDAQTLVMSVFRQNYRF